MNLSKAVKVTRASNAVAAGVTEVDGAWIPTSDFDGLMFTIAFGAIVAGAATAVKLQGANKADYSDAADLAGTGITVADTEDNTLAISDCFQPGFAYVRAVVTRATQNSAVDSITAFQYSPRVKPTTHDATTVSHSAFTQSPIAGTP